MDGFQEYSIAENDYGPQTEAPSRTTEANEVIRTLEKMIGKNTCPSGVND